MIPAHVYHYTTRSAALELILPSRSIRIGSLGETNDPRETKDWGFGYKPIPVIAGTDSEFAFDLHASTKIQSSANRIRRKEWWTFCTSVDALELLPEGPDLPDLNQFRYGYARARLWAQYAENHKGVCLVFDGPLLDEAIRAAKAEAHLFSGRVTYSDEWDRNAHRNRYYALELDYDQVLEGDLDDNLREHIRQNFQPILLEKAKDWESEQEFRWLLNGTKGPYMVDIANAISSVIVGVDFPSVYGPSLRQLCDSLNIRLEKMHWANRVPIKQEWEDSGI